MVNDCNHKSTKCMDCMRYLTGDPEETIQESLKDPNGYYPATCTPGETLHGESNERFHLTKGPLLIEINFTPEGVIIGAWDSTDQDSETLGGCAIEFADCAEPTHPTLINNQNQFIIFDEASETLNELWDIPYN